ncbi:inner membrane protein [Escherichia coli]|uniref:Inner membrane protein n=1 Tax=Escherichia coli TaxID=562 RepID=A0A376RBP5_ECOLX|nr:inner membrane protein [Escherichia coli]
MDNVELSPATRWGMIATGLLQGLVCYLLIAWLAGKNHSWIVYGVPATVAFSSVLLFSVISFKQKRLWGWLALVFIATTGMSGWLKWQTDGMNPWRAEKAIWDFGCYLLLMAMLLLPWIQQSLRIRNGSSRYSYFYQSVWHNVLILLVIFLANGLTWLVLLLWGELFKLVGITFFNTLFFATDWFIYLTLGSGYRAGGDPRANTVTFNRLYSKVVHVNRHGVAAVSIIANPDVYHHSAVYGPERDFSPHLRRRVAVNAGLFAIDLNGYCPRSAKSVTSLDGAVALPD